MNEKSQRAKIFLGAAQLMVAILLILMAVFLYAGLSTGWFAESKEVSATGMSALCKGQRLGDPKITEVNIYRPRLNEPVPANLNEATPLVQITPGAAWTDGDWIRETDVLLPGDRIRVKAEFEVLPPPQQLVKPGETQPPQETAISAEFFLRAPQDLKDENGAVIRKTEVPVVLANGGKSEYYYLSSQICLHYASLYDHAGKKTVKLREDQTAKTRLSNHTLGSNQPMAALPGDIPLGLLPTRTQTLEPGKYTITLELEFYNDPNHNQTPLRGDITKDPVIPSSFWREIVINEVLS